MLHDKKLVAFIPTLDVKRAQRFYTDILGLLMIHEDQFATVYETGDTFLRVTPVKEFAPHPFTTLGWEVPDVAAMADALIARGVKFEHYNLPHQEPNGIWSAPGGAKVAWFKDPDGNLLSISQHA